MFQINFRSAAELKTTITEFRYKESAAPSLPEHGDQQIEHENLCEQDVDAQQYLHHSVHLRAPGQVKVAARYVQSRTTKQHIRGVTLVKVH